MKLTSIQEDLILTPPGGSLLVTGPAGSGKTTAAVLRLKQIIREAKLAEFERAFLRLLIDNCLGWFSHPGAGQPVRDL